MKTKLLSVLIVFAMSLTAAGAVYWVSPAGTGDGSSSAAASSDVLAVVAGATEAGDEVRFLAGEYSFSAPIVISAAKGLTLSGGYGADGSKGGGETIFVNDPSLESSHCFISASGSVLSLSDISFKGGFDNLSDGVNAAQAILLNNCRSVISRCYFTENGYRSGVRNRQGTVWNMGAVGAVGGDLSVLDCVFSKNVMTDETVSAVGGGARMVGACIGAVGITNLLVSSSSFSDNGIASYTVNSVGGGAIYTREMAYGARVLIKGCSFDRNYARTGFDELGTTGRDSKWLGPYAGAMALCDSPNKYPDIDVEDCSFDANWCNGIFSNMQNWDYGGTLFICDNDATITRCVFLNSGRVPYDAPAEDLEDRTSINYVYNNALGGIDICRAVVTIKNSLFAGLDRGHVLGLHTSADVFNVENCTFVGAKALSLTESGRVHSVIKDLSGKAYFTNCIFWDNESSLYNNNAYLAFYNCIVPEGVAVTGENNISEDPLFSDEFYHPASQAASYHGDYFGDNGEWRADDVHSPAIDAGYASSDFSEEPFPNGGVINIGYDGGTGKASRSLLGDDPAIDSTLPSVTFLSTPEVVADGAIIRGVILSLAQSPTATITVAWGDKDYGDTLSSWPNSEVLQGKYEVSDTIEYRIKDVIAYNVVHYRVFITLTDGVVHATPARSKERGDILFAAPASLGTGDGLLPQNASADIVSLVAGATTAGCEIRFLEGVYAYDAPINLSEKDGLCISGGYAPDGITRGAATIISNDYTLATSHSLIVATNSTLAIRGITFTGGFDSISENAETASGALFMNCQTEIENCIFTENGYRSGTNNVGGSANQAILNAGAIGAYNGGTLTVSDCRFAGNLCEDTNVVSKVGMNANILGVALGVQSIDEFVIKNCYFDDNHVLTYLPAVSGGGAMTIRYVAKIVIQDCVFTDCYTATGNGEIAYAPDTEWIGPYGGALSLAFNGTILIDNCTFSDIWNSAQLKNIKTWDYGGVIYIEGGDTVINKCRFLNCGRVPYAPPADSDSNILYAYNNALGSIDIYNSAKLTIVNSLFSGTERGHLFGVQKSSTLNVINTTIAGAKQNTFSTQRELEIIKSTSRGGKLTFTNCLFGDNESTLTTVDNNLTFSYCLLPVEKAGDGNITTEKPRFRNASRSDYHLGGYSPAKNAGNNAVLEGLSVDTATDLDGKPRIYKGVVDLGCYESVVKPTILRLE